MAIVTDDEGLTRERSVSQASPTRVIDFLMAALGVYDAAAT